MDLMQTEYVKAMLIDIATTSKGYPNGSREGKLALQALRDFVCHGSR